MSKYYRKRQHAPRNAEVTSRAALLARIPARAMLLGLILCLGVCYLWLVNGAAAGGFEVSRLEGRKNDLDQEYARLDLQMSEAASLSRLESISKELGLVQIGQVEYAGDASGLARR